MYADNKTKSIYEAIEETDRRRKKQVEYNKVNNIKPRSTTRKIIDIIEINQEKYSKKTLKETRLVGNNLSAHVKELKLLMIENAENLNFEKAAEIRDEIKKLERDEIGVK